ncbi:MAG: methyltransferase [Firmicutes bacterium]|nr:methyltransferase [Bacillota bacterium]
MAQIMSENVKLLEGERIDAIGFGNLRLIQKPEEFCYGVDAVLLADFAAKQGRTQAKVAVDLGTGTGIVPLVLSYKTDIPTLVGIEVQENSWDRANRTSQLNQLTDRLTFLHEDVADCKTGWGKDFAGAVDMVTSNPPYTAGQCGLTCTNLAKHMARHETTADLEAFIRCAAHILRDKGEFFLVHRPSRIVDICCYGRKYGMEPKTMQFVSPVPAARPNILLVQMVKGGGREVKFLPHLAVHNEQGGYTQELLAAYD